MEIDHPSLFIEINEKNYIFVVGVYDENQNFKIIEKIVAPSAGINKNRLISIDQASEEIKKNVSIIEKRIDYIFKDVTIIIENFDYIFFDEAGQMSISKVIASSLSGFILNVCL